MIMTNENDQKFSRARKLSLYKNVDNATEGTKNGVRIWFVLWAWFSNIFCPPPLHTYRLGLACWGGLSYAKLATALLSLRSLCSLRSA